VIRKSVIQQAGVLCVCLLIAGCGGEPYTYQPDRELKPGPGLFSGKDGEFNLIGSPEEQEEQEDSEAGEKTVSPAD
jgi:hypothetical protein